MGELAHRLERIAVEATSPDGRIRARVRGKLELDLEFGARSYGSYQEAELARQLGQLATVTWTRYHREYVEAEKAFLDWSVQERDPHDRQFEEQAAQLTVAGSSPDGWVTMRSRALIRWDVHLLQDVQRQLPEQRFIGEVLGAATDTIRAYRAGRARLLDQFYDWPAVCRRGARRRMAAPMPPSPDDGSSGDGGTADTGAERTIASGHPHGSWHVAVVGRGRGGGGRVGRVRPRGCRQQIQRTVTTERSGHEQHHRPAGALGAPVRVALPAEDHRDRVLGQASGGALRGRRPTESCPYATFNNVLTVRVLDPAGSTDRRAGRGQARNGCATAGAGTRWRWHLLHEDR